MSKYKINWLNHEDILDWKKVAEKKQNFYCAYLGKSKWEVYDVNDLGYLKLKIGYSLFGPPSKVQEKDFEIAYEAPNYTDKIDPIMKAIQRCSNNNELYASFIYLIAIVDNYYTEFPVIRVLKDSLDEKDFCYFIDSLGNCYANWEQFLNNNVMPSCIYCYPRDGIYASNFAGCVELDYSYSPQTVLPFPKGGYKTPIDIIFSQELHCSEDNLKSHVKEITGIVRKMASFENYLSRYAIHFSRSMISHGSVIAKANKWGQIKENWMTVLNIMPEILKHAERVTYTHITQLFVSILFFCHTIVSYDTCKHILQSTLDHMLFNSNDTVVDSLPMEYPEGLLKKIVKKSVLEIKRINNIAELMDEISNEYHALPSDDNAILRRIELSLKDIAIKMSTN